MIGLLHGPIDPKYSIIKGQQFTLDAADIDLGGLVSCIGPNKTPCFLIPV